VAAAAAWLRVLLQCRPFRSPVASSEGYGLQQKLGCGHPAVMQPLLKLATAFLGCLRV
jgi:hypothetical protein